MARSDFQSPRLYIDAPLAANATVPLDRDHGNYLGNVLRLKAGDAVLVFNGRDGEWRSVIEGAKRPSALRIAAQTRAQSLPSDLRYVFAPLKHARLDYMVQKAVEMGASHLQPVLTRFTQVSRINLERMRANAIEAAEQCGILNIADVAEPLPLERFLATRDGNRLLIFCDEDADVANPVAALQSATVSGVDVLIGPEGGFAPDEREQLLRQSCVRRLSLGPRILRADTAAVAALAVVQTALGDWNVGDWNLGDRNKG
jgi:16S rRNA (uracil1498-N3)-methyltransferase